MTTSTDFSAPATGIQMQWVQTPDGLRMQWTRKASAPVLSLVPAVDVPLQADPAANTAAA